jgi:HPt (histidine-containing phosphotransfer) domain-containing protein
MLVDQIRINENTEPNPALSIHTSATNTAIPPVDIAVLTALEDAQVDGEPDLIVELIDLYLEDAPQRLEAIKAAATNKDGTSLKRSAHGLQGSSASLGVRRLAGICQNLEQLDCHDSPERVASLVKSLQDEFVTVRETLEAVRRRRLA